MYFDDYEKHKEAKLDPLLFWDMDMKKFDPFEAPMIVVQRVIERGMEDDWYAMFNMFGVNSVIKIIKELPYLSSRNISLVSTLF